MKRATIPTLLLGLLLSGAAAAATPAADSGPAADVAAVRGVVEAFRLAILRKDKPAYMRLFFSERPEQIGWQAVVDDAVLARIRRTRPEAIKARPRPENNFIALIDSVVASSKAEEETVAGLVVDTDGEIASAAFDYRYLSAGEVTNLGREMWQLVRTERGWKIFSVIYTIRDP